MVVSHIHDISIYNVTF